MSNRTINRWYCAILYKDDKNHEKYFKNINELYEQVTYIIHDKDLNEDGTTKKKHMHILFNVGENARHLNTIAKEIGIPENYLQGCNKKNMLKYLIHMKNPEKTQYNINEVKGYLKKELEKIMKKETINNEEIMSNIIEEVKKGRILSIRKLLEWAIDNEAYEEVKRSGFLLCKMIEEEKMKYKEKDVTN